MAKSLRRTPVHHFVAQMVADGGVVWRHADPVPKRAAVLRQSDGFRPAGGGRLAADVLVALWELKFSELLVVDGSLVRLSAEGRRRLTEWDATQVAS